MIAGLVGLVGLLATFGLHQGRLQRARERLPEHVTDFQVRHTRNTDGGVARIFDGLHGGRRVHLRCWQPLKGDRTWRIPMELRRELPDGVSLGAGPALAVWGLTSVQLRLDDGAWGRFICTGDNPRRLLSALLADPPAAAVPTGRERFVVAAHIDEGMLTIGLRGADELLVLAWLPEWETLLSELERVVEGPFRETAERTGLRLVLSEGPWPQLKGWVDGINVGVVIDDDLDTRITAAFHNEELAEDLLILHQDRLVGDVDLDDPVLSMLVAARCSTPDTLRALSRAEGVSEALLAVVHAYPGSRVVGDRVELVADRVLADQLADDVDSVIALARGLKG
ncbi:MAG TPA: hypothetical protein QGF58_03985 [Myxococcota bacterium]|nr:hypothetical protein [Myxococcota bacterium]